MLLFSGGLLLFDLQLPSCVPNFLYPGSAQSLAKSLPPFPQRIAKDNKFREAILRTNLHRLLTECCAIFVVIRWVKGGQMMM